MVVPLFILAILYNILRSTPSLYHKTFDPIDFIDDILGCFYGKQVSLGPCWFIYTLVLCQSIYQITKLKAGIIIAIVCLTAIQSYRYTIETITPNCITNTLLAFPVYMTGVWLQKYKTTFESMNNRFVLSSIISIGLMIVAVAGYYNGPVWMYTADSGGSVLLFMVGGVAGTSAIYALSKLLDNVKLKYLATIADGSIIILALHILVVYQSMKLNLTYGYYFLSLIVLTAFIPVIIFCKRYLPILTGYR